MEHPFIGDLSGKSMEELTDAVNKLYKQMAFATRGMNYSMANQIQMALNTYRAELNRQQAKLLDDSDSVLGAIDIT